MSEVEPHVLDHLPISPEVTPQTKWERLRVQGLVQQPLELTLEALITLAQQDVTEDFHCVEGWMVPDQRWEGVPVSTLLELAKPLPAARHLGFSAGCYTVGLSMDEVKNSNVIIALRLNGEALPQEHGGPCRLIVAAKECHFSIKWVDRIDVRMTTAEDTGRSIAQARARTQQLRPHGGSSN